MKYYLLQARLLSTLFVQENRQSNAAGGLSYLPGSSLRGAVAAKYLREFGGPADDLFREHFLDAPICFPDLLPSNSPDQLSRPLPLTASSCKRSSGFKTNGHGVSDSLAALAAGDLKNRPLTEAFACKACQHDMKPFPGFWNGDTKSPEKCEPTVVYQRHTGIDRHTGTVASGVFYITQGMAEDRKDADLKTHPQYLSGDIYLSKHQAETLAEWFNGTVIVGADRTRGMGEIELTLTEKTPPDFNLKCWDKNFRKELSKLTNKKLPDGLYFSIDLNSHMIQVDAFLRPSFDIIIEHPDVKEMTRIIRPQPIRGWQSCRQLPKTDDTAAGMGGVYLFLYTGEDVDGLAAYLKRLVIEGIGLRLPEGFGRVTICNPIHIKELM